MVHNHVRAKLTVTLHSQEMSSSAKGLNSECAKWRDNKDGESLSWSPRKL